VLFAPVPQHRLSADGEESGYFAENEKTTGFACSSADLYRAW
jgi:hypothetical protein